jgi:general secretion pathway protein D
MKVFRFLGCLAITMMPGIVAGNGGVDRSDFINAQKASQTAILKRQQAVIRSNALLREGNALLEAQDYKGALEKYRSIVALLPAPSPATASLQNKAYDGAAVALIQLARENLEANRLDEARANADEALSFAPNDPRIQAERASLYAAMGIALDAEGKPMIERDNPAITPRYLKDVADVNLLLQEGDDLLETAQFDSAEKKYQQILTIDPFNSTARKRLDKVLDHKIRYAKKAKDVSRFQAMTEVTEKWEMPIPKDVINDAGIFADVPLSRSNIENLNRKLKTIILPQVAFDQASILDVIDFLNARSKELDPEKKGINFVSRLTPDTMGSDVTLNLQNVPLEEVIRYATRLANLKYQMDEFSVSVLPLTAPTDQLLTKEYRVKPDFFNVEVGGEKEGAGARTRRTFSRSLMEKVQFERETDIRKVLEARGVTFPEGASASYSSASGKLTVRNSPANLELIDALVGSPTDIPAQVEIEAKFVELNQTDFDELSMAMNVVKEGNYTRASGDFSPINMDGLNHLDGLRSSAQLRPNSVDALLSQNTGIDTRPVPNSFNFAVGIAKYNIDILIRTLSQKKSVDLLSAPKVIARSGEQASIKIVRRFSYADTYDAPELPPTTSSGGANDSGNLFIQPPPVVTPAQPSNFTEKEVGVVLTVTPEVGPDNRTIDLNLVPLVEDFEGFINYGTPIAVADEDRLFVISENVINMPVFNSRRIETSVQVQDGSTVVLGGLLREDIQKIQDKVPILGDIPLLGRLFRSEVEQSIKKNLVIFITPRLITPTGELVNPPEPLVLPSQQTASR